MMTTQEYSSPIPPEHFIHIIYFKFYVITIAVEIFISYTTGNFGHNNAITINSLINLRIVLNSNLIYQYPPALSVSIHVFHRSYDDQISSRVLIHLLQVPKGIKQTVLTKRGSIQRSTSSREYHKVLPHLLPKRDRAYLNPTPSTPNFNAHDTWK